MASKLRGVIMLPWESYGTGNFIPLTLKFLFYLNRISFSQLTSSFKLQMHIILFSVLLQSDCGCPPPLRLVSARPDLNVKSP